MIIYLVFLTKLEIMNTVITAFAFPLLVGIILIYLNRGRLKIEIEPYNWFFLTDACSPCLIAKLVNNGGNSIVFDSIFLELKRGSQTTMKDVSAYWKTLETLPANSAKNVRVNCSEVFKDKTLNYYSLMRIRVITTNNKVSKSNWLEVKEVYSHWEEGNARALSRR